MSDGPWQLIRDGDLQLCIVYHREEEVMHDLEDESCTCRPRVERYDNGWRMIVHERMLQ